MDWIKKIHRKLLVPMIIFIAGFCSFSFGVLLFNFSETYSAMFHILGGIAMIAGVIESIIYWITWAEKS